MQIQTELNYYFILSAYHFAIIYTMKKKKKKNMFNEVMKCKKKYDFIIMAKHAIQMRMKRIKTKDSMKIWLSIVLMPDVYNIIIYREDFRIIIAMKINH